MSGPIRRTRGDDREDEQSGPSTHNGSNGPLGMLNGDSPWWARFIIIVLFYFGLPTLLVGVLLAMGAGWIPSPITATHQITQDLKLHMEHSKKRDERMGRFLAMICRNTAYTQAQQAECERNVQQDTP